MERENVLDKPPQEQLSSLFGSYKAEWLKEKMYDLFTEPAYLPELNTSRPCVLLGGRGTGKTTVLRCMSYQGQFALHGKQASTLDNWGYFGFYYRVNTNRVTAFKGPELAEGRWVKVFAHYFNLILCDLVLQFLKWYQNLVPDTMLLSEDDCVLVAASLNLPGALNLSRLSAQIAAEKIRFEAYINNIADGGIQSLSLQGAPIDALMGILAGLPQFGGKDFFFLLDEYENFEDYQQQVVNTLIKHSGESYTFKIGVRELGWRRRTTLNENEQLISPADYVRVHVAEKLDGAPFRKFARDVLRERLQRLDLSQDAAVRLTKIFPGITEEDEAERLDTEGNQSARIAAQKLALVVPLSECSILDGLHLLEKYLLVSWAEARGQNLEDVWRDYIANPKKWDDRYGNFKHSLLYTLYKKKRGIRKYYAGWNVFVRLAAVNIRYLIELVDQSLLLHLRNGGELGEPVSPEVQTEAAQAVGKKNLSELEGLTVHGAQLTKLLLGLGRIFQTLAADPGGHAPEINQFHLAEEARVSTDGVDQAVSRLLTAAVMHLALLRFPGSKPGDEGDTKDYDYAVHPIYSAFFVFPYRRKRKMLISGGQLLGLVDNPRQTIREILALHNRELDDVLPDQMMLFEAYYRGE